MLLAGALHPRSFRVSSVHAVAGDWQRQGPYEVGEVVGQGMKLEADLVVPELAARQPRPLDGVLAFLDPLFRAHGRRMGSLNGLRLPGQVDNEPYVQAEGWRRRVAPASP